MGIKEVSEKPNQKRIKNKDTGTGRKLRGGRGVESGIQAQAPWQHIERGRKELPISSRRFTRLSTSATDVALNSELSIAASSFSKTQVTRGQTVSSRLMRSPNDQTFSPSWRFEQKQTNKKSQEARSDEEVQKNKIK